jgi:hypothetical protein
MSATRKPGDSARSIVRFTETRSRRGPKSILQPDPDQCTEVGLQFSESAPGKSRVKVTHKYFERHGTDAPGYRADMASDYGWPQLLRMFAAAAHG